MPRSQAVSAANPKARLVAPHQIAVTVAAGTLVFAALSAHAGIQCHQAAVTYPSQDQTLTGARPEIRWELIEGVGSYDNVISIRR